MYRLCSYEVFSTNLLRIAGGMKTTSTIASELPPPTDGKKKGKGKKGAGNRRIKLQNTHLKELGIDLSKDFVKPGAQSSSGGGTGKKK